MGDRVDVESEQGEGLIFLFTISQKPIIHFAGRREIVRTMENYEGGNLAASKIRNLECPSYEICLIDYGCGKFNRKIHIMEQYP